MSLTNKYVTNTILGRYHDDTPDATISKIASNVLVTQEQLGYKIINTQSFPKGTIPELPNGYACYDANQSFDNFLLFNDAYFPLAFEKYDDIKKTYKAVVRWFLLKTDGSIFVKQLIYYYPRSIFTLSDSDRRAYIKKLLQIPNLNDIDLYYSSIYALKTTSPSLPFPCDFSMNAGCFKSELDYYLRRYNEEMEFGNTNDNVVKDRQDLINAFYYLTGYDLTLIGYNSQTGSASNQFVYSNSLMNKTYSTGQAPGQQPILHYVADNQTIANNQSVIDTGVLSQSDPLHEPPSVVQQPQTTPPSGNIVSTQVGAYGSETNYIHDGYEDTPAQYGDAQFVSGIGEDYTTMSIDGYLIQRCNQMFTSGGSNACCNDCKESGSNCSNNGIY